LAHFFSGLYKNVKKIIQLKRLLAEIFFVESNFYHYQESIKIQKNTLSNKSTIIFYFDNLTAKDVDNELNM
jgi:hypothetical protein